MAHQKRKQDSEVGFIHSVSPIEKAKNEDKIYYTFSLQTSQNKFKNCVGFNKRLHGEVRHFENTGSPTKLLNINEKPDQIFVNEVSSIVKVRNSDVSFQKATEAQRNKVTGTFSDAIDIKLKDLPTQLRTQKVNVQGVVTIRSKPPKKVKKRNGEKGIVKEDCLIEDETGHAKIDLWEEQIGKVESGKAYKVANLTIKNYSGNTNLGATTTTTFTEADLQLQEIKGLKLLCELDNEQELIIEEFKFIDKFNIFLTCQIKSCNKRMPYYVECTTLKWQSCGTSQKMKFAKKGMSARLCADIEGNEVWLTAFTETMQALLSKAGIPKDAKSDEIADGLLSLENIKVQIDKWSKFILKIID